MPSERSEPTQHIPQEFDLESTKETLNAIIRAAQILDDIDVQKRLDKGNVHTVAHCLEVNLYIIKSLKKIITDLDGSGYQLVLRGGDELIETTNFNIGEHGFKSKEGGQPFEPGEIVVLDKASSVVIHGIEMESRTLFGANERAVNPESLAATLNKGGILTIAEREQPANPEKRKQEIEIVAKKLELAIFDLKSWYGSRSSDSVSARNHGDRCFSDACAAFEELLWQCRDIEHEMILRAAAEEIATYRLSNIGYGFNNTVPTRQPIAPNEELPLVATNDMNDHINRRKTVYIGKIGKKVEMGELAEALSNGAEISLVPIEEI